MTPLRTLPQNSLNNRPWDRMNTDIFERWKLSINKTYFKKVKQQTQATKLSVSMWTRIINLRLGVFVLTFMALKTQFKTFVTYWNFSIEYAWQIERSVLNFKIWTRIFFLFEILWILFLKIKSLNYKLNCSNLFFIYLLFALYFATVNKISSVISARFLFWPK